MKITGKFFREWLSYLKLFLILSLSIIVLLGGVQFYTSYGLLRRAAISNNSNMLLLFKESQDVLLKQIETSMDGVFTNSLFLHYMDYYHDKDILTLMSINDQLDNIVRNNESIQSVCVYYPRYGYTLSSDFGPAPVYSYYDREFLTTLDDMDTPYQYNVYRTQPGARSACSRQVISIVRTLPVFCSARRPTAYVVINVDAGYAYKALSQISLYDDAYMLVFDQNQNMIVGSLQEDDRKTLLENLSVSETVGHGELTIAGREMIISHIRSSENGWYYFYAVPATETMGGISKLQANMLILTAAVLFASVILSVFFSRKAFEPIFSISTRLGGDAESGAAAVTTCKNQLISRIDAVLTRNEQLECVNTKYELSVREKEFIGIIRGTYDEEEPGGLWTSLNTDAHPGCMLAVFLLNISAGNTHAAAGRVEAELKEIPVELILTVGISECETAVLVRFDKNLPETELIRSACIFLRGIQAPAKTAVGISLPFAGAEQISDAYRQAKEALESRIVLVNQTVLCYRPTTSPYPEYPLKIESAILKAVKNRDIMATQAAVNEFERFIIEICPSASLVKSFYLQLYCTSQRILFYNSDINRINYNHFDLLEMDSINDMTRYIMQTFISAIDDMDEHRRPEISERLRKICTCIDANLEGDLSIVRLSDLFGIKSSAIRKMFQDELGITPKEYINASKLNKAKELLADESLKIQDIANRLGFYYSQSFIAFFVSAVGMTPGEYRAQLTQRDLV